MTTLPITRPWDTPGLPDRTEPERCRWHDGHCAYRDDDPALCTLCHATIESQKCTCEHGPLTLTRTDRIRDQFTTGFNPRDLAKSHDISTAQTIRILKGLYSRTKHAARADTDTDTQDGAA